MSAESAAQKCAGAMVAMRAHRGSIVNLVPTILSARELVLGFALATRAKAFFDRRLGVLRKGVDALLDKKKDAAERVATLTEPLYFVGKEEHSPVTVTATNGAFGKTVLSEEKARAVLATKRQKITRTCFVRVPRPPIPPPRFSGEKFRELIALGVITQAEYDGCLEPAPAAYTVTVDVPTEIEDALATMLLEAPSA